MDQTVIFTDVEKKRGFFSIVDEKLHLAAFDTSQSRDMNKIFVGKISNILPNLKAAFVEYQKGVFGFLPLTKEELAAYRCEMQLPVQIVKDAVKTKEAVLSAELSLTGVYCILTSKPGGVVCSKKLPAFAKEALYKLCLPLVPGEISCIIRTNAVSLEPGDYPLLTGEISRLRQELEKLLKNARSRTVYSMLYGGPSFVETQTAKVDLQNVTRLVTDSREEFDYLSQHLPRKLVPALQLYEDADFPLPALYGLRAKLHETVSRTVWLKSGGYLVIEPTEALTVIDVNSGKNIKKMSKKELCLLTNKEAAQIIPYILTSRNLTGIIIVDFINNHSQAEDAELLKQLRSNLKSDYVKTDVVDMTPLGLVEITRQKRDIPFKDQLCEVGLYETFRH